MMGAERRSDGHDRRREEDDRLPRGGPCDRLGARAGIGPDPQGDDHPARPGASAWSCACPSATTTRTTATRCTRTSSVSMGGRVAEEIIFGHDKVSSGASSDISYATSLARNMVTKWGMSDKLGPLQYEDQQEGYLGYGGTQRTMNSDRDQQADRRRDPRPGRRRACPRDRHPAERRRSQLHLLAQALLEYETLTGEEIKQLLDDGRIDRPEPAGGPDPGASPRAARRSRAPASASAAKPRKAPNRLRSCWCSAERAEHQQHVEEQQQDQRR